MKILDKMQKIANFLRIIGEDGLVSLSNVAVMVVLVKIALSSTIDLAAAALLLPAIGNYAFKSYTRPKLQHPIEPKIAAAEDAIKKLNVSVEKLRMKAGFSPE